MLCYVINIINVCSVSEMFIWHKNYWNSDTAMACAIDYRYS